MAETQRRTVRVDDSLWDRFEAFCSSIGTTMSARIVQHIESDVESHEGSKEA